MFVAPIINVVVSLSLLLKVVGTPESVSRVGVPSPLPEQVEARWSRRTEVTSFWCVVTPVSETALGQVSAVVSQSTWTTVPTLG